MTSPSPRIAGFTAIASLLVLGACGGTRLPESAFNQRVITTTGPAGSDGTGLPGGTGTGTGSGQGGTGTGGSGLGGTGSGGSGLGGTGSGTGGSGTSGTGGGGTTGGTGNNGSGQTKTKSGGTVKNTASDRGVTPTSINVCNVVTKGGPFGPYQFTPSYYGAAAYFQALNAAGGVNGRKVNFVTHPDDGSDSGNLQQIHTCIDQNNAFAFVANDIYQYAGAGYVNQKGIPDIGGAPISTAYYLYPHLFAIYGDHTPRNGKTLGDNGYNYRTDQDALFLKDKQHVTHVGVVFYDQASSQYGANNIENEFKTAGVKVTPYQVNLGLPNFQSVVAQMKSDGVDIVADAIDLNGSQKLCQAIEQNGAFLKQMKVKLSTVANWTSSLGNDLKSTPGCLGKSWVDSQSANFADSSNPQVAAYNAAMRKYFPSDLPHNHQFGLEGWAAAMWFTDAARSCGANLTRVCVEKFMNRPQPYSARGLMETPLTSFKLYSSSYAVGAHRQCVSMAQWSLSKHTWVTRASLQHDCYTAKGFKFQLTPPT
ncbi:MAG: ABC transporter substrate-binding protein [Frankiaceae bacterium]|nr:ABC transporter substrate-binding protein [Frankiaceae bacterium]